MANVNKVILIGRLTRDPEVRTFSTGGKVLAFGFAVTNRKKNPTTGQWDDDPMFIDVKIFNRGEGGRQADIAEQSLRKGHQVFLEGKLVLETWEDKQTGQKRSKHVVVVDNFQFLEPRAEGAGEGAVRSSGSMGASRRPAAVAPQPETNYGDEAEGAGAPPEEDIPF